MILPKRVAIAQLVAMRKVQPLMPPVVTLLDNLRMVMLAEYDIGLIHAKITGESFLLVIPHLPDGEAHILRPATQNQKQAFLI